jgi:hypothetical protein
LLDRLQNGTHRGKTGETDQSTHGRMGLRTARKEEISRMDGEFWGKEMYIDIWVEENCLHRQIPYIIINA